MARTNSGKRRRSGTALTPHDVQSRPDAAGDAHPAMTPEQEFEQKFQQEQISLAIQLETIAKLPIFGRSPGSVIRPLRYRIEHQSCQYVTVEKCLEISYGSSHTFWDIAFSEPLEWVEFRELFICMLAVDWRELHPMGSKGIALDNAMLAAHQQGAQLLYGDTSSLDRAEWAWQTQLPSLRVDGKRATAWLLSKPLRRHLVPPSAATFVTGAGAEGLKESRPETTAIEGESRKARAGVEATAAVVERDGGHTGAIQRPKTGPRPRISERVRAAMVKKAKEQGIEALMAPPRKVLPSEFGAGETTCYKIRLEVFESLTNSAQTVTKD